MSTPESFAVLRLRVRNHPGVLSHVCGLFARRAFNLEAIACVPQSDRRTSVMVLAVLDDERLPQAMRQLAKLEDVECVTRLPDGTTIFHDLAAAIAEVTDSAGYSAGSSSSISASSLAGSSSAASPRGIS